MCIASLYTFLGQIHPCLPTILGTSPHWHFCSHFLPCLTHSIHSSVLKLRFQLLDSHSFPLPYLSILHPTNLGKFENFSKPLLFHLCHREQPQEPSESFCESCGVTRIQGCKDHIVPEWRWQWPPSALVNSVLQPEGISVCSTQAHRTLLPTEQVLSTLLVKNLCVYVCVCVHMHAHEDPQFGQPWFLKTHQNPC